MMEMNDLRTYLLDRFSELPMQMLRIDYSCTESCDLGIANP